MFELLFPITVIIIICILCSIPNMVKKYKEGKIKRYVKKNADRYWNGEMDSFEEQCYENYSREVDKINSFNASIKRQKELSRTISKTMIVGNSQDSRKNLVVQLFVGQLVEQF